MIKLQQKMFAINTPLGKFNYAVASVAKNLAGGLLALMLGMILAQVIFSICSQRFISLDRRTGKICHGLGSLFSGTLGVS